MGSANGVRHDHISGDYGGIKVVTVRSVIDDSKNSPDGFST
jgi:hypothetical protein